MGMAGLALVLAVTNGVLFSANRRAQFAINVRQGEVQQAAQLQVLQTEIAKALAELAIRGNDQRVFDLLAANGITVTRNGPAEAPPARPPAPSSPSTLIGHDHAQYCRRKDRPVRTAHPARRTRHGICSHRHTNRAEYSIFAPLMLSTALVVWFAFQTVQLVRRARRTGDDQRTRTHRSPTPRRSVRHSTPWLRRRNAWPMKAMPTRN